MDNDTMGNETDALRRSLMEFDLFELDVGRMLLNATDDMNGTNMTMEDHDDHDHARRLMEFEFLDVGRMLLNATDDMNGTNMTMEGRRLLDFDFLDVGRMLLNAYDDMNGTNMTMEDHADHDHRRLQQATYADGISLSLSSLLAPVADAVSGAVNNAEEALSGAADSARDAVSGAVDSARDAVSGAVDTATDFVGETIDRLGETVDGVINCTEANCTDDLIDFNMTSNMTDMVTDFSEEVIGDGLDAAGDLLSNITDDFGEAVDAVGDVLGDATDGLLLGGNDTAESLTCGPEAAYAPSEATCSELGWPVIEETASCIPTRQYLEENCEAIEWLGEGTFEENEAGCRAAGLRACTKYELELEGAEFGALAQACGVRPGFRFWTIAGCGTYATEDDDERAAEENSLGETATLGGNTRCQFKGQDLSRLCCADACPTADTN